MKSNEMNYVKRLKRGKEDALEFILDDIIVNLEK
ncbi:RNA polymerase sigma-70 factor, ECF subfamily [Clostridium uliginosum]|uniref:RNA polymerase sigma-70 factor, ECF subfamily n=1 Tax=Clostridium uliginosum TaxID=119641 RepID=A0A1I1IDI3_9CLOT|nr:RNA polymerase sigma-70 factor, ECF subfamily [Clostridium uliginosum]